MLVVTSAEGDVQRVAAEYRDGLISGDRQTIDRDRCVAKRGVRPVRRSRQRNQSGSGADQRAGGWALSDGGRIAVVADDDQSAEVGKGSLLIWGRINGLIGCAVHNRGR